jgi:hypothetical protein
MVPLVYGREDAEAAVAACKYPPRGSRSAAYPVRAVRLRGEGWLINCLGAACRRPANGLRRWLRRCPAGPWKNAAPLAGSARLPPPPYLPLPTCSHPQVYRKGVGVGALAAYLRDANQETEARRVSHS